MSYDEDGFEIPHLIRCRSAWPACNGGHATAARVRACYEASRTEGAWPCSWLTEARYDDGSIYHTECGAVTQYTDDEGSYACERGHDFIPPEVLARRHQAYAEDDAEARQLSRQGVQPLAITGGPYPL
jgi:hypothetical protein